MPGTILSDRSLEIVAHIASRGIGWSLFSDGGRFLTDSDLARRVLADAGFSPSQVDELARKHNGLGADDPQRYMP